MSSGDARKFSRRSVVGTAAAFAAVSIAAPAFAQTATTATDASTTEIESDISNNMRRNISSFRSLEWQPYFDNLQKGAILVDITSRALHFWNEDATIYKLYPTSVALTEDLTRRGRIATDVPGGDRVRVHLGATLARVAGDWRQTSREPPVGRDALRDGKSLLGVVDGGLKGFLERHRAETAQHGVPAPDRARDRDGQDSP